MSNWHYSLSARIFARFQGLAGHPRNKESAEIRAFQYRYYSQGKRVIVLEFLISRNKLSLLGEVRGGGIYLTLMPGMAVSYRNLSRLYPFTSLLGFAKYNSLDELSVCFLT